MQMSLKSLGIKTLAVAAAASASPVFAGIPGGSLVYGPDASGVPTLGGSALIVLAILLAVVAFRVMRTQQHRGVNLVVALTAATALASGIGGVNLVSDAMAAPSQSMTLDGGGSVPLFPGFNQIDNATDLPQQVLEMNPGPFCSFGMGNGGNGGMAILANGGGVGVCMASPSTVVPPGSYCYVELFCET